MSKIYKYFGGDVIELVFAKPEFCGVKCSYPKNYNDPYELFLAMEPNLQPEHLAFYNEVIQELPQLPTTCFSKSPIASPMWAHYANNHSGFVLEFDLNKMHQKFDGNPIWDVSYRKKPHPNLAQILKRAAGTLKPRHVQELREYTFVEAYFSKYDEWSYEEEIRFVDTLGVTSKVGENDILFIPIECITKIIVGSRVENALISNSLEIAQNTNIKWIKQIIGKSNPKPYFMDVNKKAYRFNEGEIVLDNNLCNCCSEPLINNGTLCSWCQITDRHEDDAAMLNPFRLLERAGLLEKYIKGYNQIRRSKK